MRHPGSRRARGRTQSAPGHVCPSRVSCELAPSVYTKRVSVYKTTAAWIQRHGPSVKRKPERLQLASQLEQPPFAGLTFDDTARQFPADYMAMIIDYIERLGVDDARPRVER